MDLMEMLSCHGVWQEFCRYKLSGGHLSRDKAAALTGFVERRGYLPAAERIRAGESFAPPRRVELSKLNSDKKRVVYTYAEEENWMLKLLTWLLQQRYDGLFAPNLYSFRPRKGVRDAVLRLVRAPGIGGMWSYKVDIRNYFNSVPVERMASRLEEALADQPAVCRFLTALLTQPWVQTEEGLIREEKGIMAGTPVSAFLANLYLAHMDRYFQEEGVLYARYSDDIILFAPTEEELDRRAGQVRDFLAAAGLTVNPSKEARTAPGETWTFLGICCRGGTVDVAPVSVAKLKGKMRRKMRALLRWQGRTGADGIRAARAFVRTFNRKLFENPLEHELTWARWYFPLITTADTLREIDDYSRQCIRTLATGKHTKAAYQFRHEEIKGLGYISLVSRYYHSRRPA